VSFLLDYKHLCVENFAKQNLESSSGRNILWFFEQKKGATFRSPQLLTLNLKVRNEGSTYPRCDVYSYKCPQSFPRMIFYHHT